MKFTLTIRRVALALALVLATLPVVAQDTRFYVESTTVDAGEEVRVEVRGIGIADLVGLQFSLQWDTTVLEFLRVEDVIFDGALMTNFNVTQIDTAGRIGYLHADQTLQGFGAADSSLMFALVFDAITAVGTTTSIGFTSAPLSSNASDNRNMIVEPLYTDGEVRVIGPSSIRRVSEDSRLVVLPNPMTIDGQIRLVLDYASEATLDVLDTRGRVVHRRALTLRGGENLIPLPLKALSAAGTYIVRLSTDREQLHRKVVRGTTGG